MEVTQVFVDKQVAAQEVALGVGRSAGVQTWLDGGVLTSNVRKWRGQQMDGSSARGISGAVCVGRS